MAGEKTRSEDPIDHQAPALSEFLDREILPRLTAEQVFDDPIHRFQKSNGKWRGACPWHHSKSGTSFVVDPGSKSWWCQGCHDGGGPIKYRHKQNGGTGTPRNKEFVDLVRDMAKEVGVPFPERTLSREEIERAQRRETRRTILETVMVKAREHIPDDVRDYLHSRGFTDEDIINLRLGYYGSVSAMREAITAAGHSIEDAKAAGVLKPKWEGYVLFPWNDEYGHPLTIYGTWREKKPPLMKDVPVYREQRDKAYQEWEARSEEDRIPWEEPTIPKKMALPNPKDEAGTTLESTKRSPLYFDRARRAGHKHVVLVEGVTDAAFLQCRGDTRVVACVASSLSKLQAQTMARCGVKSVTICLDPDVAGENGIASCVRSLNEVGIAPKVAPKLPDGMDPDEFVQANGIEAWYVHIDQAKTPLLRDIDLLSAKGLDQLQLVEPLGPIKEELAKLPEDSLVAHLDYIKKSFKLSSEFIKGLRKEISKLTLSTDHTQQSGARLTSLDSLQAIPRVHPAIDFHDGFMTLGFRVDHGDDGDGLVLIVSDGDRVEALVNVETLEREGQSYRIKSGTPPFVNDTWNLDRLRSFTQDPTGEEDLFQGLKIAFRKFLDLPEPVYGLMAAWVVGTFFSHLFTAFPFLYFHGPKECGKSNTLEALRCVSFNSWKGRDISVAALGDTTDGLRGTLLLDQAEKLDGSPETGNLIGLLADSYKKAGGRRRIVEVSKSGRSVLEFSTYGPKAFASTKRLDPDLADRCVRIPMTRTRNRLPDLEGWEPIWPELRDKLYRFTLTRFKEVLTYYQGIEGTGTRTGELWRPMKAVLQSLNVDQSEIEEIRGVFTNGADEGRHELNGWEQTLFDVLKQSAEEVRNTFEMSGEDILRAMDIQGEKKPGDKWVGEALSRFSLCMKKPVRKKPDGHKKKLRFYTFDHTHVLKLHEIYVRDSPLDDRSRRSKDENVNDSSEIPRTDENRRTGHHWSQATVHNNDGPTGTGPTIMDGPGQSIDITNDSGVVPTGPTKTGVQGGRENNAQDLYDLEMHIPEEEWCELDDDMEVL